ncbi:MAG TPA: DUF2330 domain-containing protein [Polyangiaceae bacterium]|nr:DUF2330 domain-containing protein [Polyangiaceae bacterium]
MRTWKMLFGGACLLALELAPRMALACGGCFHNPAVDSVVTGHRMAFAVSDDRTVLWDQIQYSGDPGDFGWVLPVEPGATIELSTDAWFEALEAATSAQISPPQLLCVQSSSSSGCFGSSSSDSAGVKSSPDQGGFVGPGVTVIHQGSLGPFETVTLRSTDSGSLRAWLSSHDYAIQDDVDPIIDAYIMEGMDFIALRLMGTEPMQPVRVVTPKGDAVLPLRMVMAGTGSDVQIVLYTIGEARLGLADLTEVKLDTSQLTYDFNASTTNYDQLRADALSANLGASFLTTFAAKTPFSMSFTRTLTTSGGKFSNQLGQLYFDQGVEDEGTTETGCSFALTGLTSDDLITEDVASQFSCGDLSDLSAAMVGMHPSRIWLSRLEMDLPRDQLGMDCHVNHAPKQDPVSSDLAAVRAKNRPSTCEQPIFESRIARERTSPALAGAWSVAILGLLAFARRIRRRR